MEYTQAIKRDNYPDCISLECTEKIIEQMKLKVCKILLKEGSGTGFFGKIKFPNNKLIPALITNNHVINESILENENNKIYYSTYNQKESKYIQLNDRMKYTNKDYDITIIEIKENDNISENMYFDIELNNNNIIYCKTSIYVLHYPNEKNISVSYGILNEIYDDKEYEFQHYCTTYEGSSGSPILDILNNKIIGIHKGGMGKKYNLGTFINYPINKFIEENYIDQKLIAFNKKYNLNIRPNITQLDLSRKDNECINYLKDLSLKELKELNISNCGISDIGFLEKVKFVKLEKLVLGGNVVKNINILEKVNFKELKELDLYNCGISNIDFLERVNFKNLEKLDLEGNKISNINILEKVNFKELKELDLIRCELSDIGFLEKVKFEKLERLYLDGNKISNINILEKANFKQLKELDLGLLDKKLSKNLKIKSNNNLVIY